MVAEQWDKDMLMGKTGPMEGKGMADAVKSDPMLWGRAGHLTEEQADIYEKVKNEIVARENTPDFASTIYSFGEEEGEVWALLRWCRARKFVYDDIIKMVDEAMECRAEAKKNEFYLDPKLALGCDMALYMAQFPQVYSGYDKNGIPLFFSKPAKMNIDAVEAITTLQGIIKFHWHYMMIDFGERLRAQKADVEGFHRFECVCVMDLSGLAISQLGSRTLAVTKEQAFIDSLCFPETMNRMVIVNAPSFFSATWKIIKTFIDGRTAGKVDVISSRKKAEERLLELADADQLPSDYGGTGPSTEETLNSQAPGDMKRLYTEVMYIRGSSSYKTEINEDEEVEVFVWTRSVPGAKFSIVDQDKSNGPPKVYAPTVEIVHKELSKDQSEKPTSASLTPTGRIVGPANIKVKADSNGSRFSTSSEKFLVQVCVYNKSS
mmetsp:Transcript_23769/g.35961  ORF Transcript_23769/g.35961 Transcript_23769/m.35961 type:complete len:434 (+) Transcript_23769:175-1476(+)|eukprot:CAMPEP_0194200600 /NCGR_PEP_ID=MMETSP0156-20130528/1131_1 /TAXON_ID=33649 /ORGANISM="Thalassionema nitzschioides, Strain L26-B" /LENGTH=433 /DNA_ID=CAMNT_0038925613 /DNA_START=105 /DNA_END=1406 /DNA_ORIENTATION=+